MTRAPAWLPLALLVTGALALRLHGLGAESLFMDELLQVRAYGGGAHAVLAGALAQAQPPLDYLVGSWTVAVFGDSDFSVRLPAALWGAIAVGLLYGLAREWTGRVAAAMAALALALSPFHLYYSQEARPYAMPFALLLAVWLLCARILRTGRPERAWYLGLFAAALACLHSSALYPLVAVTVMAAALGLHWAAGSRGGVRDARVGRVALVLGVAVLAYLPMFLLIVRRGARYAPRATQSPLELLQEGLGRLDPRPLLEAFLAQTEPFAAPLLAACLAALVLPWLRTAGAPARGVALFVAAVTGASALLHLVVFVAASDLPFRPPYPGYLLPGVLLLGALGVDALLRRLPTAAWRTGLALVLLAAIAVQGGARVLDFKTWPKRADWRGVAALCTERFDERNVLVFATLGGESVWKPTFFGFPRYYRGRAPQAELGWMAQNPQAWLASPLVPALVLFSYDDYLLTRRSPFPVLRGQPGYAPDARLANDPRLRVTRLHGFWLIEPAQPAGDLRGNLEVMVAAVREHLPRNAARSEWDALAKVLAAGAQAEPMAREPGP